MKHLALALALLAGTASADVKLAALFGDHMVFQRETRAPVWGWADPGESITVRASWDGKPSLTLADEDGKWMVRLDTPEAGGPHTVTVSGKNEIVLNDVFSGEVWVCSGQSNMQWGVSQSKDPDAEIAAATHPLIRFFNVQRTFAMEPQDDCTGEWSVCDPSTIAPFSAVGYYFGRELLHELEVPIGLIGSNWGGTVAESWTSEPTLRRELPEFAETLDRIDETVASPGTEPSVAELQAAWWQRHADSEPGMTGGWMDASFDDDTWSTAAIPGRWEDIELKGFDGCVWYRRVVELPNTWGGRDLALEIGPVDDMDLTWFNGELVGETRRDGAWNTPRSYFVPAAAVKGGANVITVCAVDTGGVGQLGDDTMRLRPADEPDAAGIALAGDWKFHQGASMGDLGGWPRRGWFHQNRPTALSNGMIAPLVPFAIRGAIWYQGESNVKRAAQYRRLFPAMIEDWRERWGRGDFPFYFVQLAPFGYGGDTGEAAELREAQTKTLSLPSTGMAVTMDIGNPTDIHPRNKQDVGKRLALWALAKTYGKKVKYSGPLYRSMAVEGAAIRLTFDHAEGLTSGEAPPSHFTIAGADQVFHAASARIDGETVVVSSDAVAAPVAVRFAWGAADEPNLKNGAGLPAPSFRTDHWPPVSAGR